MRYPCRYFWSALRIRRVGSVNLGSENRRVGLPVPAPPPPDVFAFTLYLPGLHLSLHLLSTVSLLFPGSHFLLWEGFRESRRYSRDTHPESYITKSTSIPRITISPFLSGVHLYLYISVKSSRTRLPDSGIGKCIFIELMTSDLRRKASREGLT